MKVADRHGRPLSEVLAEYPDWEIEYWSSYYSRMPSDGDRVEFGIARLTSNFIAANSKPHSQPPQPLDLILPNWYVQQNKKLAARQDMDRLLDAFAKAGVPIRKKGRGSSNG